MLISDWSSDVCSSDLTANPLAKVNVLDQTLVGSSNPNSQQLLGVSALSPTQSSGQLATVGVLSGGEALTVNMASTPAAIASGVTGAVSSVTSGLEAATAPRSAEHTSEHQSLMRHSSAVFCSKTKQHKTDHYTTQNT